MTDRHEGFVDSGVPWIGDIPASWSIRPLWSMYERVKDVNHPDEQMLSVFRDYGVVAKDAYENINKTAEDRSIYQLVHPGWLVTNRMKAWQGSVGISPLRGIVSGHYICFAPQHEECHDYLNWLFRSPPYVAGHEMISRGVRPGQAEIDNDQYRILPVVVPPLEEQKSIADYLDHETEQIDTLIAEQQRLVGLLRERRFAVRSRLATSGMGTPAETRASGLFWAGDIPAHWRVVPLTSVASLESGHTPSRTRPELWEDCYIPWISLNDVGYLSAHEYISGTANLISDAGIAASSARILPAGTVVLSRDATVGRSGIMAIPMATSQHFANWICGPDLDPRYLWLLFTSAMQPYFDSLTNGSTLRTIGMGHLKAFRVPLPPVEEQRGIVEAAAQQTGRIDTLITESERLIELSLERRSALITAAVTGRIDVREEAA